MRRIVFLKSVVTVSFLITLQILFVQTSYSEEIESLESVRLAVQAANAAWIPGETSVSRLPAEERKKRNGYLQPPLTAAQVRAQQEQQLSMLSAPSGSFDWRNFGGSNYVTPVRDQGECGSCWAFGTTAALESYVMRHGRYDTLLNLSEQIVLSCSNAGSCNGGYPGAASDFIAGTGVPPESFYPYTAGDGACSSALSGWQRATDSVVSWQYVTTDAPSAALLKNAIYTYGPIVSTMSIFTDFYCYRSGVYHHVAGTPQGAHVVLVVGYSDDSAYPGGGYFIAKNSWGTGWGEPGGSDTGGYFRIAYSELASATKFGWYTIAYDTKGACSYRIENAGTTVSAGGGPFSVGMETAISCTWSAVSNAAWLLMGGAGGGTGSNAISYTVAPNTGADSRSGLITVKDAVGKEAATYTVTQRGGSYSVQEGSKEIKPPAEAAPAPKFVFTAGNAGFTKNGGAGTLGVAVDQSKAVWSATSAAPWLVIQNCGSGSGNGAVSYSVSPNLSADSRTAGITIRDGGGKVLTTLNVFQGPVRFGFAASGSSFGRDGGAGSLAVTVDRDDAPWSAAGSEGWLEISTGAKGTGSETISYAVAPNRTARARTGTITVKDCNGKTIRTLTVSQAPSSFSVSAFGVSFPKEGGSDSIGVSVDRSDAAWSATSSAGWLVIRNGGEGAGNGTVLLTAAANDSAKVRTAAVTVKDSTGKAVRIVHVTQWGR